MPFTKTIVFTTALVFTATASAGDIPASIALGYPGYSGTKTVTSTNYGKMLKCPQNFALYGICLATPDEDCTLNLRDKYKATAKCHCLELNDCNSSVERPDTEIRYIGSQDGRNLKCNDNSNEVATAYCVSKMGEKTCANPDDGKTYFAVIGCSNTAFNEDSSKETHEIVVKDASWVGRCDMPAKTDVLWFTPQLIKRIQFYGQVLDVSGEGSAEEYAVAEFDCHLMREDDWKTKFNSFYKLT